MSGGADATVRIWDIKSQTLMASVYVVKPVRSVVWWCKKDPITGSNCKVPPTPPAAGRTNRPKTAEPRERRLGARHEECYGWCAHECSTRATIAWC
jgi:hypothetical protein